MLKEEVEIWLKLNKDTMAKEKPTKELYATKNMNANENEISGQCYKLVTD